MQRQQAADSSEAGDAISTGFCRSVRSGGEKSIRSAQRAFGLNGLGGGVSVIRIHNITTVGIADSALPDTKPISQPLIWNPREVTLNPVSRVFQGQSLQLQMDTTAS